MTQIVNFGKWVVGQVKSFFERRAFMQHMKQQFENYDYHDAVADNSDFKQCFNSCIDRYYGQDYYDALDGSYFAPINAAVEYGVNKLDQLAEMKSIRSKYQDQPKVFDSGKHYKSGMRIQNTLKVLRGVNGIVGIKSAYDTGFTIGATGYCAVTTVSCIQK